MLILKEQLGKSAEHWKTVRKNADLSPGLSLESGFVSFNRVGEKTKYKPIDEKNKNEQTINTQRSKTMFMFFLFLFLRFPFFPSVSFNISMLQQSFLCLLFICLFFPSLPRSLCFPVVCMLFVFCFSDLF
jgi:cellulose synthase/poly-beta-1,6-N-acetylglucosamine synthase-like glycosyltransferase